jgi:hypothetical protein
MVFPHRPVDRFDAIRVDVVVFGDVDVPSLGVAMTALAKVACWRQKKKKKN